VKLRNPPPKRPRITKKVVREARQVLNEIHAQLFTLRRLDMPALNLPDKWRFDMSDRLCALCAWLNTWEYNERRAAKARKEARNG